MIILLCILAMASVLDGQTLKGPTHGKKVVCYVASWATYRPGLGKYTVGNLDPKLCTHIVYSFAGLDEAKNSIKSLDPWQDLEKEDGMAGYKGLVALKEQFPHLKCTIAIGGWNEGSVKYSNMAANPESRKAFIQSVMTFLNHYNFDGLDLDWEYPTKRDGKPEDRENFVLLVKELSQAFESRGYILTAALGAAKATMETAYDLTKLSRYLDLIHMMCYDYHGTWDGVVGANAPLRSADENDVLSVEYTINYMIAHGVSPYKLILGIPFYGRTFILQNPDVEKVELGRTPVMNKGFRGPHTGEDGFFGYNEICKELSNQSSSWSYHWDAKSATPFVRDKERVICYDNARSIAVKVKYAVERGLGGFMVWSIDTDDFLGHCSNQEDAYIDFSERLNGIVNDPVLGEALKTLNLPDDSKGRRRIDALSKGTSYVVSNGKLSLRLPQTDEILNYKLLRTINDAASLALQEKRILDEMERVTKENEINGGEGKKPGGSSGRVGGSLFGLLMCLFVVGVRI